jgi:hypothetical protein
MVRQYEERRGHPYDFVIRARPDTYFVHLPKLANLSREFISIPAYRSTPCNDHFAVMPRRLAEVYFEKVLEEWLRVAHRPRPWRMAEISGICGSFGEWKTRRDWVLHRKIGLSECVFYRVLHNDTVIRDDISYFLVRDNNRAECVPHLDSPGKGVIRTNHTVTHWNTCIKFNECAATSQTHCYPAAQT